MLPFDRRRKHLKALLAIRTHGPLRFNEIQRHADLKPPEVDRILHALCGSFLLVARLEPGAGKRAFARYELTKAGAAHLKAFDVYAASLRRQARVVGEDALRELDAIYA